MSQQIPFNEMLSDLNGGVFEQKITRAMAEVALKVVHLGKKGSVIIRLDMARIGDSSQINLTHSVEYKKPTQYGTASEIDETSTPMHVGPNGALSITPASTNQIRILN